jgi:hypothetical protein
VSGDTDDLRRPRPASTELAVEIASIAIQISRIQSRNDATHAVSRVFSSSFEAKRFKPESCVDVGEKLYLALEAKKLLK